MSKFFIHRPIFAWVIAIFVILAGLVSITMLPVSQYPLVAPPTIRVISTYPGADAKTIDETVNSLIEREMNGIDGLMYMDSKAMAIGMGELSITFKPGTDPDMAQVDVQTGEIKLVSFLRDLYVRIPHHGSTRLNAAYVYGGAELLKQTLAENFGVKVDCTLAVNFSLMVTLMDRIGGVWVEVSSAERKQLNSILKFYNTWNGFDRDDQLLEDSGLQLLTGKQALCYSRIRKIDSDFQRTGRQRKVLMGIFNRVREMDALTLAEILRASYGEVSTDLTLSDVAKLLPLVYQLENATFDSLTVPVTNGYRSETVHGSDVLTPNLKKNREAIADFLY